MFTRQSIKHCKVCGGATVYVVPADDNRERATCTVCQTVHYENPLNVVGTVPTWGDQVLLCRRNIEPRYGLWTLPAGFMELDETVEEGAARETDEEAGAHFEMQGLFTVLSVKRVGQVHMYFRARLLDTEFAPGPETIEARLFPRRRNPVGRTGVQNGAENPGTLLRGQTQRSIRSALCRHRVMRFPSPSTRTSPARCGEPLGRWA